MCLNAHQNKWYLIFYLDTQTYFSTKNGSWNFGTFHFSIWYLLTLPSVGSSTISIGSLKRLFWHNWIRLNRIQRITPFDFICSSWISIWYSIDIRVRQTWPRKRGIVIRGHGLSLRPLSLLFFEWRPEFDAYKTSLFSERSGERERRCVVERPYISTLLFLIKLIQQVVAGIQKIVLYSAHEYIALNTVAYPLSHFEVLDY